MASGAPGASALATQIAGMPLHGMTEALALAWKKAEPSGHARVYPSGQGLGAPAT